MGFGNLEFWKRRGGMVEKVGTMDCDSRGW